MKKTLTIVVLLLFAGCSLMAQKPVETVFDNVVGGVPVHSYFDGMDNQHYILFSSRYTDKEALVSIPGNNGKGQQLVLQHPADYELLVAYEDATQIRCIYKCYKYDTKTYGIYLNVFPKDAESVEWNPEAVFLFPLEKTEDIRCWSARSPDQSKAAVALFLTNTRSNSLKGSIVMTFDENGLLWKNPLDLEFENNTLEIFNFAVSNEAKVYTAILSFNKENEKDKSRKNETLHLFESSEYGEINSTDFQVEFGSLSCGRLLITHQGNVMIGGYYAPKYGEKETGCYIVRYDMNPLTSANISHEDFPSTYYNYVHTPSGKKAQDFSVYPSYFFEFSDGTVALLGEMYTTFSITMVFSAGGSILVHFADKNGDISQFKTIEKVQTSVETSHSPGSLRGRLFSYSALMHNDRIHLFFADNVENYHGKSGQNSFADTKFFTSELKFDGLCAAHSSIDRVGNISKPDLLIDYSALKSYMFALFYMQEDGVVFLHSGKKSRQISKYKHDFE